ncbi:hypothetical protein RRG08_008413 [Elysia crispata]|uniref:Uncharacterized protein n=1 Tax=Elysia crispata TaxID=231223 RepID=A0AAE0ZSL5_9GAST|nr:hypothetical protein RRG08_008413 [Elysia crispata]
MTEVGMACKEKLNRKKYVLFLLQTTEQIKERLDRMLNTPDTSLVITDYPEAPEAYDAIWVMAFAFPNAAKLQKRGMNLEDFEETTNVIFCAMN